MLGAIREFFGGFAAGIRAEAADPNDERFWNAGALPQVLASAGIRVSPAIALQVSCVFQAVRVIAETLASLPLKPIREYDDGRKEVLRKNYLWRGLHAKKGRPNAWQTGMQFRETMLMRAQLWGAGYARIKGYDPLNLVPLDPEATTVDQVKGTDRLLIRTVEDGQPITLVQDEVFRVEGIGVHRFMPLPVLLLAREAVGLWLAVEKFEGLFFAQGARPGLFVEHPGSPKVELVKEIQQRLQAKLGGLGNMHKVVVGEKGMKLTPFGFSPKDSQMNEAKDALVSEVARWFNFPLHMLRSGKQPTFASVEQFGREFIDITLRPVGTRFEGCVDRDLIADDDISVEHIYEGLLQGNTLDRFTSYVQARTAGWLTRNEIRAIENRNPLPGGDDLDAPLNSNQSPSAASPPPPVGPQAPDDEEDDDAEPEDKKAARPPRRVAMIAMAAARRIVRTEARVVVRKELAALEREAPRLASNPDGWRAWLVDFYQAHELVVADVLELEPSLARAYAGRHREALAAQGVGAAAKWESEAVDELAALALEESEAAA